MRTSPSRIAKCIAVLCAVFAIAAAGRACAEVDRGDVMARAERVAMSYDYDRAIEMLESLPGHEDDPEVSAAIERYRKTKEECVPVKPSQVTHIFYHSLVVDPVRAFSSPDKRPGAIGHNQWMTTIGEFNKITDELYKRGFVYVSVHDVVEKTVDEKGRVKFKPKELMLPKGKKAVILSLDDISYYHSYNGFGYASKIVLDDDGRPMCQYTDSSGSTSIGMYDSIPLLDAFIEEHPDASYRGAKGIIALTGYNGILGYRTDETYDHKNVDDPKINRDKRRWLKAHPEFDRNAERERAKAVCDALRAEGWEFASHSWGHIRAGKVSMNSLRADTKKWLDNVAPLVGGSDVLIYAHGDDIGGKDAYSMKNERYSFLKKSGFDYFFGVNSNSHTLRIYDDYVHGGRRNLDGIRMYSNVIGKQKNLSDLFDAKEVLDPTRPPVQMPK